MAKLIRLIQDETIFDVINSYESGFLDETIFNVINSYETCFPKVLNSVKQYLHYREKNKDWDDKYLIPDSIFWDWVNESGKTNMASYVLYEMSYCVSIIAWFKSSQVLKIDTALGKELLKYPIKEDAVIPKSIFDNLPYYSAYVDLSDCSNKIIGFFYNFSPYLDSKTNKEEYKVEFLTITSDEECRKYVYFPSTGSLKHSINKLKELVDDKKIQDINWNYIQDIISNIMSIIFYLSASNREMTENKKIKYRYKPIANIPNDIYKNINYWNIGTSLGVQFKRISENNEQIIKNGEYIKGGGCKKRPHTRRAHIHHYWIGSKNSPSRQLIYYILAPISVNGGNNAKNIAKHEVTKEK